MGKVADPLRELVGSLFTNDMALYKDFMSIADEIDREHACRMEQSRHETKRAFAKYVRQVTAEYERGQKRKSWVRQQEMQLELDVLKFKDGGREE